MTAPRHAHSSERSSGINSSPASIQSLHHLAGSLEDAGDLEGAAQQYETALAFKLRTIGTNFDELAELQFGLANLHINWQHYSRARELLYEAAGERSGARAACGWQSPTKR